jgi:hypothetical protein
LWPSGKGSYWIYDWYGYPDNWNIDTNWVYKDISSFGINYDTIKSTPSILRTEVIDSINIALNDTIYPAVIFDNGFKKPYYVGADGIYNLGIYGEGDSVLRKGLYVPADIPLNIPWNGQISFRMEGKFIAEEVIDRRCISLDEIVKTPAGSFTCYVIKTRIIESEDYIGYIDFYEYYSPGIGLVAKVKVFTEPEKFWILDGISFLNQYYINR